MSIKNDLTLEDKYYEADAVERVYITQALRVITDVPSLIIIELSVWEWSLQYL